MSGWEKLFALLGLALALIPWALQGLRVKVPRWAFRGGLIVGIACLVGSVGIPAYQRFFTPPTYVYLFPGRGLGERSIQAPGDFTMRRVFVLQQVGPDVLHNVEVVLRDNRAQEQTGSDHTENYPEVGPGESTSSAAQPKHFWIVPSSPWSENYTVTIRSGERAFVERILIWGINPPAIPGAPVNPPPAPKVTQKWGDGPLDPALGEVALAIRVTESGNNTPLFTCRDSRFQQQPEWLSDNPQPCSQHSTEIPSFEANLDPKPFVLSFPGGLIDMTPKLSQVLSSHPETEPTSRVLSGWQKAQMTEQLEKLHGQKLLILFTGGSETFQYAKDFRDVFRQSRWVVRGPLAGPKSTCTPIDVALWAWKNDFRNPRPQVQAIRKALEAAGVKGGAYHECLLDSPKALVLWVGVKSPNEVKNDVPPCPQEPSPEVDKLVFRF